MKRTLSLLFLTCFIFSSAAIAADKVVVIPLSSSRAKGDNGQLQFNDNGNTAGAELYYNKNTGNLQTTGEVRITDSLGANRLWGEGRPGVEVAVWLGVTSKGYKQGMGNVITTWYDAASGCPQGAWVCTTDDIDTDYGIGHLVFYPTRDCNGNLIIDDGTGWQYAWLCDALDSTTSMRVEDHSQKATTHYATNCNQYNVMCCTY